MNVLGLKGVFTSHTYRPPSSAGNLGKIIEGFFPLLEVLIQAILPLPMSVNLNSAFMFFSFP
jgi:hypothetical protein